MCPCCWQDGTMTRESHSYTSVIRRYVIAYLCHDFAVCKLYLGVCGPSVTPFWYLSKLLCQSSTVSIMLCSFWTLGRESIEISIIHGGSNTSLDSQFDFRRGSSCIRALFIIRQLSERTIEYDKEINILFVDR